MTETLIFDLSIEGVQCTDFPKCDVPEQNVSDILPSKFLRKNPPRLPQVSEPTVVRHFTRLSQLNFSEDTHFYPLGSCTMKYNPKINEVIAALPSFSQIHPYQDESTVQGILQLLWNLEKLLCELTGMDAFSLHPAAGAQGELVGLMIAKSYFKSLKDNRTKVIVPDSAHGTNPASAALAGFSVQSIPSNKRGRVDIESLKKVLGTDVALVMLTCPNTLGLFENQMFEIADIVHEKGALLYMDGANFNALVGLVNPSKLGFDLMHLNLHKTFGVPHGGGGPGSGPVGVKKSLEKFLPLPRIIKEEEQVSGFDPSALGLRTMCESNPYKNCRGDIHDARQVGNFQIPIQKFRLKNDSGDSIGRLRSFIGSTGALIRAYTYIVSLGVDGLKAVSENAILNANYLLNHLKDTFKPYVDEPCMHECVLSASAFSKDGIKTLDIAKRLLDYGFYAPTVYFPLIVPEAIMIEPTETESKKSLDHFVETMKLIAEEIKKNPKIIQTAPHTTPVRRLDEVSAARNPILKWKFPS